MKITRQVQMIQYLHNRVQKRMRRENGERNSIKKNNSRTIVRTKEIELLD